MGMPRPPVSIRQCTGSYDVFYIGRTGDCIIQSTNLPHVGQHICQFCWNLILPPRSNETSSLLGGSATAAANKPPGADVPGKPPGADVPGAAGRADVLPIGGSKGSVNPRVDFTDNVHTLVDVGRVLPKRPATKPDVTRKPPSIYQTLHCGLRCITYTTQ